MQCLRRLTLYIPSGPIKSLSQPSTPKDIVPLSNLTCLHYVGYGVLLDALLVGLSAPSFRDVDIYVFDVNQAPPVHLPQFINEIRVHFYTRIWQESSFLCSRERK
jgi:hypothetical protein